MKPLFKVEDNLGVPYKLFKAKKADFVQTTNLPKWAPGANHLRSRADTQAESTPGKFASA